MCVLPSWLTMRTSLAGNSSQTKNLCPPRVKSPCTSLSLSGLSIRATEEITAVLGVSASNIKREWNVAKAWLTR